MLSTIPLLIIPLTILAATPLACFIALLIFWGFKAKEVKAPWINAAETIRAINENPLLAWLRPSTRRGACRRHRQELLPPFQGQATTQQPCAHAKIRW